MFNSKQRVVFYPDYSGGNPYQKLLYKPLVDLGWKVDSSSLRSLLKENNGLRGVIFHMHWINAIFVDCNNHESAWAAVDDFLRDILLFKSKGGVFLWTIHNHLPHENPFSEQDLRLRFYLCESADRIHLHCGSHVDELSYLPITPSKVVIQRHGSYLGYYSDFSLKNRLESFDIEQPKALFVGMLREYKDIESLINVVLELNSKGVSVTIAGKPESDRIKSIFEEICVNEGIQCILRRLSEAEIHELCNESDIGILSYDKILTSGTLKLYLSYAMQIISPNLTTLKLEDRFGEFLMYDAELSATNFNYGDYSREDYFSAFSKSFFLAQESRWSASMFDFQNGR